MLRELDRPAGGPGAAAGGLLPRLLARRRKAGADKRRSGYQDMGPALQKMQDDDTANPGMLLVQLGQTALGQAGRRRQQVLRRLPCRRRHEGRRGALSRRSPKDGDKPIDLEGRIKLCRTANQQAEPLAPESRELLSLTAFVANQSRGLPIAPPDDPRLAPFREQGAAICQRRQGQLNLSCAICHDDNAGKKLAGVTIPQAHPTGYPLYRLEWQAPGLAEAPPAQLLDRHPGRSLSL